MSAARFASLQRVEAHQLGELEKVGDATCLLERLIERVGAAWHIHVAPELLSQRRNQLQCLPESCLVARHPAVLPHDVPELAMKRVDGARSLDREKLLRAIRDS